MELSGYLAIARRWWWTLLIATWVAGLSGYVVASGLPRTYEAEVRLLVGPFNTDLNTQRAAGQTGAGTPRGERDIVLLSEIYRADNVFFGFDEEHCLGCYCVNAGIRSVTGTRQGIGKQLLTRENFLQVRQHLSR